MAIIPQSWLTGLNQQALTTGRPLTPNLTAGVRQGQIAGQYQIAVQNQALQQALDQINQQSAYQNSQLGIYNQQLAQSQSALAAQQEWEAQQLALQIAAADEQKRQYEENLKLAQEKAAQEKAASEQQIATAKDAAAQQAQTSAITGGVGALGTAANVYKLGAEQGLWGGAKTAAGTLPTPGSAAAQAEIDSAIAALNTADKGAYGGALFPGELEALGKSTSQLGSAPAPVPTPGGAPVYSAPPAAPAGAPQPVVPAAQPQSYLTGQPVQQATAYSNPDVAQLAAQYQAEAPAASVAPITGGLDAGISGVASTIPATAAPGIFGSAAGEVGLGLGASGAAGANLGGLGATAATEAAAAATPAYASMAAMPAAAWLGPALAALGAGYTIFQGAQNRTLGKDQALSTIGADLQYLNRASQNFTGDKASENLASWLKANPNGPALTGDPSFRGGMEPNGAQDTLDTVIRYANTAGFQPDQFKKLFAGYGPQQMSWLQSLYNSDPNLQGNPKVSAATDQLQRYGSFFNDPNAPWVTNKDNMAAITPQDMQNYWGGTAQQGAAPTGGVYSQVGDIGSQLLGRSWAFPGDWPTGLSVDDYTNMIKGSAEYQAKQNQNA